MDTEMNTLELPAAVSKPSKIKTVDCPLCGFQFKSDEAACSGCGMMRGCSMLKCPNCNYEFVAESKIVNWFVKLVKRGK